MPVVSATSSPPFPEENTTITRYTNRGIAAGLITVLIGYLVAMTALWWFWGTLRLWWRESDTLARIGLVAGGVVAELMLLMLFISLGILVGALVSRRS